MVRTTLADRFPELLAQQGECLLWTRAVNSKGYGLVYYQKRMQLTHRVALKLAGVEVPDDRQVCHTCDVRLCCAEPHLYVGTYADNRRDQQIRNPRPLATHCSRGHEYTEGNTYWRPPDFRSRTCLTCKCAYDHRRWLAGLRRRLP